MALAVPGGQGEPVSKMRSKSLATPLTGHVTVGRLLCLNCRQQSCPCYGRCEDQVS